MTTFKKFLAGKPIKNDINKDIIKLRQEELAPFIVKAFKTIECKNVKIKRWELITDENKFDPNLINVKHIKNKKNKKFIRRMAMNDSRYDLLKITYELRGLDENRMMATREFTVDLLLFKRINNYYYQLSGKKYMPLFQLVDASTYTTKNHLINKTLVQPITLSRDNTKIITVTGEEYYAPVYYLSIFKGCINPLYLYLGTIGYENTMNYMQMTDIIKVENFRKYSKEKEYCFTSPGGLYVKVIKYFFDNDLFVRFMTASLINVTSKVSTMQEVMDINEWTVHLGYEMTKDLKTPMSKDKTKIFEKGKSTIFSFNRILDEITQDNLRLSYYNKSSAFAVLRWMLRNYSELKAKDNMNLLNKRIRCNEVMAAYVIKRMSTRMNKFMAIKNGTQTLEDCETLVKMDKDFVIRSIMGAKSSLFRSDSSVNDQDLFTALKYTVKGIGAMGETSSNSINDKYRGLHLSYIGRLDLNSSSSSDPGLSGSLTPFVKLYGQFFSEGKEPETWDKNFKRMWKNYFNKDDFKIYKINHFYKEEKKSYKLLKRINDISKFIEEDPYTDGIILLDVTKQKVKKVYVGHDKAALDLRIQQDKELKAKTKKKRGRKKKKVVTAPIKPINKKKTLHIKRNRNNL